MFLKAVTMQGFKSFANRTKIELDKTTTAIVGPNGSGKSNITDAITWVLGETSVKNLRGNKMEDVIFSGTDTKKPLGMAEVTIVFDNSDKSLNLPYNEVSVTRRMYRSLESEFLINNKKCRLKDIKELFMDTGIGKDGYSVIGQGKIESVLSSKPEDRRNIFEEAAGISKYKYKKIESTNKLLKTEENLIRIEDILSEIKMQEKNLKAQSDKAKSYLKDYELLRVQDINLACKDIDKREIQIRELEKSIDILKEEFKEVLNKREVLTEDLRKSKEKISDISVENDNLNERFNNYKGEYEELNLKINLENEKVNSLKRDVERIQIEIESLQGILSEYKENIEHLEINEKDLNCEKKKIADNLTEKIKVIKELEYELKNLEEIGNLNFENKNKLKNEIENLDFKNQTLKDIIEEKNNRKISLEKSIENFRKNENEFIEIISKDSSEIESLRNSLEKENLDYKNIDEKLENLQEKLKKQDEYINERKNSANEIIARLKILENMESNYEGYNRTVKSFMNFTSKNNIFTASLYGPVAEKFNVEKRYEKAISVALGSMSQNIIVSSTSETSEMLRVLEKNKMGRATFLPLDRVVGNKININYKDEGIIGVACNLIVFYKVFKDIFYNLLGRVLIVDNFKNATLISKKYKLKVVTLKGEVFNPSGAITGGSLNNYNSSFILRKNEINDLQEKKEKILKEVSKLEKEKLDLEKEIKDLNISKDSFIERKNSYIFKINEIEKNLYKNKNDRNLNTNYLDKYEKEKLDLEDNIKIDISNLEYNESEINKKNLILNEMEKEVDNSTRLKELSEKLDNLNNEKVEIQLVEKENSEKLVYNIKEIERISFEIENTEKRLKNNFDLLEEKNKAIYEKNILHEKNCITLQKITKNIEDLKFKISDNKDFLEKNNKIYFENKDVLSDLKERSVTLNSEIEKLTLKIDVNKNKISNEIERLNDEYNICDYHDFIDESLEDISESSIKKLKKKVRDYGEVNISSIDEYKLVKERLDFYASQRDDLINSKEEIKSILGKLDIEMKKIFNEAMEEISNKFTEIFKILFNGGRAEISIEGDVLSSGIEIKASPPGKRLQSLSLLSGGERSLTAVALLFALLKYRPASFCILDEIDAALDDANIKRYADYLLTLEDIQFIIITHRKLTMEIANTMYGVTMEEKGISKLYSVKLKD